MSIVVTRISTISISTIARVQCERTAWVIWALLACQIQECVIYLSVFVINSLELTYTLTHTANYQRQMLPPQPRRPSSRQSVLSGSHSSLMSSNYMPIYPNPQFAPQFRQNSMTSLGQVPMPQQQQGPEWQDAMVKMEHCLAMLNSLQMTPNQMTQMSPNQLPMMSQQQQQQPPPPQQQMVQQQPMLRSIPPFRPTVNQVQR